MKVKVFSCIVITISILGSSLAMMNPRGTICYDEKNHLNCGN